MASQGMFLDICEESQVKRYFKAVFEYNQQEKRSTTAGIVFGAVGSNNVFTTFDSFKPDTNLSRQVVSVDVSNLPSGPDHAYKFMYIDLESTLLGCSDLLRISSIEDIVRRTYANDEEFVVITRKDLEENKPSSNEGQQNVNQLVSQSQYEEEEYLTSYRKLRVELEEERKERKSREDTLVEENTTLKITKMNLEKKCRELENKGNSLDKESENLKKEKSATQTLQMEITRLKLDEKTLTNTCVNLEKSKKKLSADVAKLTEKLGKIEAEYQSLSNRTSLLKEKKVIPLKASEKNEEKNKAGYFQRLQKFVMGSENDHNKQPETVVEWDDPTIECSLGIFHPDVFAENTKIEHKTYSSFETKSSFGPKYCGGNTRGESRSRSTAENNDQKASTADEDDKAKDNIQMMVANSIKLGECEVCGMVLTSDHTQMFVKNHCEEHFQN